MNEYPPTYAALIEVGTVNWYISSSGQFAIFESGNVISNDTIPLNTWTHLAFVFTGSQRTMFIGGVKQIQTSSTTIAFGGSNTVYLGSSGANTISGYMDDFRLTIGTARYAVDFSVPTAQFPDN